MNKTLLLGAWIAAAGAAVGLGFLAVSLVGAAASPSSVEDPGPPEIESGSSASSTTATGPSGEQSTVGGTVFASCAGGSAVPVLSGAPAPGWWADNSRQPGTFEFKNSTRSVEVRATCVAGAPRFTVEGPRTAATSSSPGAPSTDAVEPGEDHGGGGGRGPDG